MPEVAGAAQEPTGDSGALRALLRDCAATLPLADGAVTPIAGGLSNQAWRLEAHGAAWFVRRGHPGAARLGVDRRSECVVLRAVSGAGLAPEVLACEPTRGLLVTRFVAAATWQACDARERRNLRRMGRLLARLHRLPIPRGAGTVSYARQALRLEAGLPMTDGLAIELRSRAGAVFARLAARAPAAALCHHDLHHLNVLDDGERLWLVDWEYGGRGDPLFDVAGFLALHDLGPEAADVLLDAYGGFADEERALLTAARWAFDYVQWLWYRSRFASLLPPGGEAAQRLAQRLLHCDN